MTPPVCVCVWPLQFDTTIKECSSALQEKQYVAAAQQLEKVAVPLAGAGCTGWVPGDAVPGRAVPT